MAEPTELWRRIARVGARIDPELSERDVARLVVGGRRLARRRALRRGGAALGLTVVAMASLGLVVSRGGRRTPTEGQVVVGHAGARAPASQTTTAPAPGAAQTTIATREIRLPDGSVVASLDSETKLTVRETSERKVAIDLERGRGRFEVTPRPVRTFVVRAGEVSVTVLGTIFRVERVADRVGVEVERGRVLIEWPGGSRRLSVGQGGWFPPLQGALPSDQTRPAPVRAPAATRAMATADPSRSPPPGSLIQTEQRPAAPPVGTSVAAVPTLEPSPPAQPSPASLLLPSPSAPVVRAALGPGIESLLAAADAARVDGRAEDAVALLRQAVDRYRSDRRAPLAAFTLGRVLLMELRRPREAAAAFAQARSLSPSGTFAEDALAREVEALSKAGDLGQARARADEYRRLYPTGGRAAAVRSFGGAD